MKQLFFSIAICGLLFASCGNKSNSQEKETLVHAEEHDHNHTCDQPKQESFEVKGDSTIHEEAAHTHEDGSVHTH